MLVQVGTPAVAVVAVGEVVVRFFVIERSRRSSGREGIDNRSSGRAGIDNLVRTGRKQQHRQRNS